MRVSLILAALTANYSPFVLSECLSVVAVLLSAEADTRLSNNCAFYFSNDPRANGIKMSLGTNGLISSPGTTTYQLIDCKPHYTGLRDEYSNDFAKNLSPAKEYFKFNSGIQSTFNIDSGQHQKAQCGATHIACHTLPIDGIRGVLIGQPQTHHAAMTVRPKRSTKAEQPQGTIPAKFAVPVSTHLSMIHAAHHQFMRWRNVSPPPSNVTIFDPKFIQSRPRRPTTELISPSLNLTMYAPAQPYPLLNDRTCVPINVTSRPLELPHSSHILTENRTPLRRKSGHPYQSDHRRAKLITTPSTITLTILLLRNCVAWIFVLLTIRTWAVKETWDHIKSLRSHNCLAKGGTLIKLMHSIRYPSSAYTTLPNWLSDALLLSNAAVWFLKYDCHVLVSLANTIFVHYLPANRLSDKDLEQLGKETWCGKCINDRVSRPLITLALYYVYSHAV